MTAHGHGPQSPFPEAPTTMTKRLCGDASLLLGEAKQGLLALIGDALTPTSMLRDLAKVVGVLGELSAVVESLACRELGPLERVPDVAPQMVCGTVVRNRLDTILEQARTLNKFPGENADEKRYRHNLIIAHAEEAQKLLGQE